MNNKKSKSPNSMIMEMDSDNSRRTFLKKVSAATVILASAHPFTSEGNILAEEKGSIDQNPWYRRVNRWGQINITLDNASNFDRRLG